MFGGEAAVLLSLVWPHRGLIPRSTTLEVDTLTINPHRGSRFTILEVDTLTIDPTGTQFHDLQHSRWTHLQLTPQGLNSTIYNTRGGHTYNRPHRGSRSTTLEVDTLTIDPTGVQFHDLQHSRWIHLQLTPQGPNSTTYNTRGGHTYNKPDRGSRSTTLEVDTLTIDPLRGSISRPTTLEVDTLTIDPTGAQFHDIEHSRWTHLQLTAQGLNSKI